MYFFLIFFLIYLFGCAGFSLLGRPPVKEQGPLSSCGAGASVVVEHGLQARWASVVAAPRSRAQAR